jgi:hypothetical protein
MREIFYGMRETEGLLLPSGLYGGVDASTFLSSLSFFVNTLLIHDYEVYRGLRLMSLYHYVATDICRDATAAVRGRMLMTSALIACDRVSEAHAELHAIFRGHDLPRPLMVNETLDVAVTTGAASADQEILERFNSALSPYHTENQARVNELLDLQLGENSPQEQSEFALVICEFVLKVCAFKRVAAPGDEDEKVRAAWLAKVDERLKKVWKDTTQTEGDALGWNPKEPTELPPEPISEELSTLAIKVRLALSVSAELRGDLSAAVKEVTFAMAFIRDQAPVYAHAKTLRCEHRARTHADVKQWMRLRRRLVALLSAEGRIDAVNSHVEQGLREARQAGDRLTAVELLYFSALSDVTAGKILEVHHDVRKGAVPTLERLLRLSSRYFPVPPKATVLARGLFYILLEQNTQIASLVSDAASDHSVGSTFSDHDHDIDNVGDVGEAEDDDEAAHDIALLAPKRPANGDPKKPYEWVRETPAEFRERKRALAETLDRCIDDLEIFAGSAGFEDAPADRNLLLHFHTDEPDPEVSLLPPASGKSAGEGRMSAGVLGVRHLGTSDTRSSPNVYFSQRPLLLHFQLLVARLRLQLGELASAKELLQSAELRIHQCLHVLPSMHVELGILKLRWRRLCMIPSHGIENPPPVPGGECKGISPPTLSFFFRPWTTVMRSPPLTAETDWRVRNDDEEPTSEQIIADLDSFLGEVRDAVAVCVKEGGHDFNQLEALLYEALREALRQYGRVDRDALSNATVHSVVGSLFNSLATASEKHEKLRLRPTEFITDDKLTCPLPLIVERAVTQGLARQGQHGYGKEYCKYTEGYASVVTQRTAVLFLNALRRESAAFYHLNHDDKHTCDSLHVALQAGLPSYAAEACLNEESFPPVPKDFGGLAEPLADQVISYWATAEANETNPYEGGSHSELVHFFVYLGPTEAPPVPEDAPEGLEPEPDPTVPMVAVLRLIVRSEVRGQYDLFCEDVTNGKPASRAEAAASAAERRDGFATSYIRARLEDLQRCLRCDSAEGLERLLRYLADVEDGADLVPVVDAQRTVELLGCISKMLCVRAQPAGAASRVKHAAFNLYLRRLLRPFEVLGSFATPDKDPEADGA